MPCQWFFVPNYLLISILEFLSALLYLVKLQPSVKKINSASTLSAIMDQLVMFVKVIVDTDFVISYSRRVMFLLSRQTFHLMTF